MKIMKKKTRKAIRKSVSKMVNKHGREIAAGLVGSIASALATLASTEAPDNGGKSNLTKMSKKLSKTLVGDNGPKLSKLTGIAKRSRKSAKRARPLESEGVSQATT